MMQMVGNLIDPVDFPELVQKLRFTIVEAHEFPELGAVALLMLNDLPPDFYLAE